MILCVNPNAAIDKTVVVSPFLLNEINRPKQVWMSPGGKGCNVARALRNLSETSIVTGWVGGFAGQFIEAGLRREGIGADFVHTDFESRTCLSIVDPDNNTLTELYEVGERVSAEQVGELIARLRKSIPGCAAVTLSGSLPPGVPDDFYAQALVIAHEAGVPGVLDASGEAVRLGAAAKPLLIKSNRQEFADLSGRDALSLTNLADSAQEMAVKYQALIVVSLGADGAIAAGQHEAYHLQPPEVTIKSAVGSGDSMLAGITYGLTRSMSLSDAVKFGVAAGTANALTVGAGVFTRGDFEKILTGVTINNLSA